MTEESQAPQDVGDASPHSLVARLREFGPAGWFFVVFLVVAIAAVALSFSGGQESAPPRTEATVTDATGATTTAAATSTTTAAGNGDAAALRAAMDSLEACLDEDDALPLRVIGAAGDRIEVGTRNQDRVEELGVALAESTCLESLQDEFPDVLVVVVGPDDRRDDASPTTVAPTPIPDTTDGSVVPTAPSTDNTLP